MSWSARVRARAGELVLDVQVSGTGITALLGPNGAGKSTLLRALAGLHPIDSGRIVLENVVVADTAAGVRVPPEARRVGYLPQGYALFPHLSALDNVAFRLARQPRRARRQRARAALQDLDAAHLADRRPAALSGGERQRVALARALVVEPRLLLLDEPLAALDVGVRRATRAFLAERVRAAGVPAVLITHDLRDVHALADQVLVLEAGRVVQAGPPAQINSAPASAFAAEFFDVGLS